MFGKKTAHYQMKMLMRVGESMGKKRASRRAPHGKSYSICRERKMKHTNSALAANSSYSNIFLKAEQAYALKQLCS